jgi:hypothetical protein
MFAKTGRERWYAAFSDNDSWSTNEIVISRNAAALYNFLAARRLARGN